MTDIPNPQGRWYCLTPDRFVVGLLVMEVCLLLSAWFQWFPVNRHKGWTVLIAVMAVGLGFLVMFLWFLAALLFRRQFQFSLRSLLLLVVVVAIPCSWLATEMRAARKQRGAVEAVWKAAGSVIYDCPSPIDPWHRPAASGDPYESPSPSFLFNLTGMAFGRDFVGRAVQVTLPYARRTGWSRCGISSSCACGARGIRPWRCRGCASCPT